MHPRPWNLGGEKKIQGKRKNIRRIKIKENREQKKGTEAKIMR